MTSREKKNMRMRRIELRTSSSLLLPNHSPEGLACLLVVDEHTVAISIRDKR